MIIGSCLEKLSDPLLSICWFPLIQADSGGTHLVLCPSEGTAWGEGEGRDGANCEWCRTASQTTVTHQHTVRSVWLFFKLILYMYFRRIVHIDISFENNFLTFSSCCLCRWYAEEALSSPGFCWGLKGCDLGWTYCWCRSLRSQGHLGPAAQIQTR